jgi:metal-sulfur cluster biosynthetic enzyme
MVQITSVIDNEIPITVFDFLLINDINI